MVSADLGFAKTYLATERIQRNAIPKAPVDVLQLLEAGLDERRIREYLKEVAPELLDDFESLLEEVDED
jgi:hypothetical protein